MDAEGGGGEHCVHRESTNEKYIHFISKTLNEWTAHTKKGRKNENHIKDWNDYFEKMERKTKRKT